MANLFSGAVCAAAVAARLLGLTADKTANALGIALTMTTGAPGKLIGASPSGCCWAWLRALVLRGAGLQLAATRATSRWSMTTG